MKIFQARKFIEELKWLPKDIQRLYKTCEDIFVVNWKDSRLHTKKLRGENTHFSFRITRKYRVLFVFLDENSVLFVSIGHRKDIYN